VTNDDSALIQLPPAPADQRSLLEAGGVACWSEPVEIGTYEPADPDRYPLFLDRRVYQGSSGRVYPIPFVDRIAQEKTPRLWQAIHLENEWVRLMLLPEIGGRIHIGYDKTNGYDFFYRNNVIKPALVGLAGPWISGGVEFNWPQHHRPGTFLPVETAIERTDAGDVTVWHSDLDPLQRMRGSHGVRLRGDSSVIEVAARLHNRTDEPQTFLWWANAAARSHADYQSFFPTDVRYVADHARRAITAFPRADRPYYGVDYPALADAEHPDADRIDFYGNIPVPTSYMITDTRDSFFGGYDHDARAGFVHWADRSIAPGKKQWTWGNGPIGRAWDAQLTDGDGPYVELMAGVYTDNQPDFSDLAPGETRRFSQFWYPIRELGPAQQATREIAVSLRVERAGVGGAAVGAAGVGGATAGAAAVGGVVHVGASSAAVHERAIVVLEHRGAVVAEWESALSPAQPFVGRATFAVGAEPLFDHDLTLRVLADGRELIVWQPRPATTTTAQAGDAPAEPSVATEPLQPAEIASVDELYLTGVHLVQYRHPTRSAVPYFEEVLRRDPLDSRASVALGAWHFRRGDYAEAQALFERALERLTRRNLNPASGEASYRLALVLERQGEFEAAADRFAKAAWDAAWAHPAALALARLALRAERAADALTYATGARRLDSQSPEARHLAILALRRLGRDIEAEALLDETLEADPLDPVALALAGRLATADPKTPLLVATGFARAGQWDEALALTAALVAAPAPASAPGHSAPASAAAPGHSAPEPTTTERATPKTFGNPVPLAHYLRATWLTARGGADSEALAAAERAAAQAVDSTYAFPAGLDEHDALVAAIAADPADAVAPALLGAWLLDAGRTADARAALENALANGAADPVAWRNAAVATVNTGGDPDTADAHFARALELSPDDPRLVFERDLLASVRGVSSSDRLAAIERHDPRVFVRDDLTLGYLDLLLMAGRTDDALSILSTRRFQPFEGGEGKAIAAYDRATLGVARRLMETDARAAAEQLAAGIGVPANLGEGRHPADSMAERFLLLGDALERAGDVGAAVEAWRRARSVGGPLAVAPRPAEAADFWAGVAHLRLGEADAAEQVWAALDARAEALDRARPQADYFATSLPELLLFDTDTAAARAHAADELRDLAGRGRTLSRGEDAA
jgi:tetratricopeptide (TPR) repeat protein